MRLLLGGGGGGRGGRGDGGRMQGQGVPGGGCLDTWPRWCTRALDCSAPCSCLLGEERDSGRGRGSRQDAGATQAE